MHNKAKLATRCNLAILAIALAFNAAPAHAQAKFSSPEAAADALVDALARNDDEGVRRVLGPDFRRFIPAGSISQEDIYTFLGAWAKRHEIETHSPASASLVVGNSGWAFPVPMAKTGNDWHFDMRAGQEEIQRRRIGRNELGAMAALRTLCEAQDKYRATVGDGKSTMRLVSRAGQRDGLYWPATTEGEASPLGPDALVMQPDVPPNTALHGYRYAIVAGAKNGCAFVAWPAEYGKSGIRSFVIRPDQSIAERDFGRRTGAADYRNVLARDSAWDVVAQ
jgi:hypothetical protein